MLDVLTMRPGDSGYYSGAHCRQKRRPLYVLVNMGEGRVAFGRDNDVINPAAAAQIRLRKDLQTYLMQEVLSEKVILERELSKGPWQTAMVSEEDITEPFRGEGEPEMPAGEPIFNLLRPESIFYDFGIEPRLNIIDFGLVGDPIVPKGRPSRTFIDVEANRLPFYPDGKWGHRDLRPQPILPDILEPILPDILVGLFNLNKGPEWPTPQDFSAISALFKAMKFFKFVAERK